jgi:hypothetical protein
MRVFVPGSIDELRHYSSGHWEPERGYAVTERLLEISAYDDPDELAEQARDAAAEDSIVVLGSRLRLVGAIDLSRADVAPVPDAHPAAVTVAGRVMPDAIACFFLDEAEAAADARAAAGGDEDALERLEERDLLWYDVSELDQLPV